MVPRCPAIPRAFLEGLATITLGCMTHSFDPTKKTPPSLLAGLRAGDAVQWNRFNRAYRPLLLAFAASKLPKAQKLEAEAVVQDVLLQIHRQNVKKAAAEGRGEPEPGFDKAKGRFWYYLITCVDNGVSATMRRQPPDVARGGDEPLELSLAPKREGDKKEDKEEDKEGVEFRIDFFIATLADALADVRDRTNASNPLKWKCFVERAVRRRKSAAIAAEFGVRPNTVDQYYKRTLEAALSLCSTRYLVGFDEVGLHTQFEKLQEQKPGFKAYLCRRALVAVEPPAPEKVAATDHFRIVLRDHLPALREKNFGPATWAAFRWHVRAVAEGDDPGPPPPDVAAVLAEVTDLLRRSCDVGELDRAFTSLSAQTIAILCDSYIEEGLSVDDDPLP
jgi:DNA-directed RNA polymerase specialized sigma24 family protein